MMSVSPQARKDPKPYVSPALTVHGDIATLTRATGNQGNKDNSVLTDKWHRTQ